MHEILIEDEEPAEVAAAVLGVTESRVSQLQHGPVAAALEEAVLLEKIGDEYRDNPEASKLVVRWIKL